MSISCPPCPAPPPCPAFANRACGAGVARGSAAFRVGWKAKRFSSRLQPRLPDIKCPCRHHAKNAEQTLKQPAKRTNQRKPWDNPCRAHAEHKQRKSRAKEEQKQSKSRAKAQQKQSTPQCYCSCCCFTQQPEPTPPHRPRKQYPKFRRPSSPGFLRTPPDGKCRDVVARTFKTSMS